MCHLSAFRCFSYQLQPLFVVHKKYEPCISRAKSYLSFFCYNPKPLKTLHLSRRRSLESCNVNCCTVPKKKTNHFPIIHLFWFQNVFSFPFFFCYHTRSFVKLYLAELSSFVENVVPQSFRSSHFKGVPRCKFRNHLYHNCRISF